MTAISNGQQLRQAIHAEASPGRNNSASKIKQVEAQIEALTKEIQNYVEGIASGEIDETTEEKERRMAELSQQLAHLYEQLGQLQRQQVEEAQQKKAESTPKQNGEEQIDHIKKITRYIDVYI